MSDKVESTLASSLRNQLTPIKSLIDFLENEPVDKDWECKFRVASVRSCKNMEKLLNSVPYKVSQ